MKTVGSARGSPKGLTDKQSVSFQVFVAILLVAAAVARPQEGVAPQSDPNAVQILRYENDNTGLGSYRFA